MLEWSAKWQVGKFHAQDIANMACSQLNGADFPLRMDMHKHRQILESCTEKEKAFLKTLMKHSNYSVLALNRRMREHT